MEWLKANSDRLFYELNSLFPNSHRDKRDRLKTLMMMMTWIAQSTESDDFLGLMMSSLCRISTSHSLSGMLVDYLSRF